MDKGRIKLVSTVATVLIIIYLVSTLDILREEDKSESEYLKAFGNVFTLWKLLAMCLFCESFW